MNAGYYLELAVSFPSIPLLLSTKESSRRGVSKAMDGLSGAASVIAVIQLLDRVATLCHKYAKGVKNAKSDIQRLQGELSRLRTILGDTQKLLQGPNGARLETSQQFGSTLKECSSQLDGMEKKLEAKLNTGRRGKAMTGLGLRALKWPFESEEANGIIQSLTKFRDTLSVGLNVDQTYVAMVSLAGSSWLLTSRSKAPPSRQL